MNEQIESPKKEQTLDEILAIPPLTEYKARKFGREVTTATKRTQKIREIFSKNLERDAELLYCVLKEKAVAQGDVIAIREIFDRAVGKAAQVITTTDETGEVIPLLDVLSTRPVIQLVAEESNKQELEEQNKIEHELLSHNSDKKSI